MHTSMHLISALLPRHSIGTLAFSLIRNCRIPNTVANASNTKCSGTQSKFLICTFVLMSRKKQADETTDPWGEILLALDSLRTNFLEVRYLLRQIGRASDTDIEPRVQVIACKQSASLRRF